MSGRLFRNVQASFRGPVYPVNPNTAEIESIRTYPTICDVPEPVDLAIIATPAASVIGAARHCIEKGVRGLVVISAGFSEAGPDGRIREGELRDLVRAAGVRMVGPNCFGVFNTDPAVRLQGTFAAADCPPGNVAVGSQSGALGVVIPDYLRQWNLGVSTFASIGNKADVNENDLLACWRDDSATDVIVLYLESLSDPVRFRALATDISSRKPILAIKAGRSTAGVRAAGSHTAALASPDRAADALFCQAGVPRAETLEDLFGAAALLATQPLPSGDRVAILTNAGGPAILCADALAALGLDLPLASPDLQAALRRRLRPQAAAANPVDLIGSIDPEDFRDCLALLFDSREFDAVISIYVPREAGTSAGIAQAVREVTRERANGVTSLCAFMETAGAPAELQDATTRIPAYIYAEAAARALALAREYARRRSRPRGSVRNFADMGRDECRRIIEAAHGRCGAAGGWLEPQEVQLLLAAAGWRVPRWRIVTTAADATAAAADWGSPVVLKVVAPDVLHKSDLGGVVANVAGRAAIQAEFHRVLSAAPAARSVLVQEFLGGGRETIVGVTRDPQFGPLIVCGCGGTLVELLDDVACRMHPLTDVDAEEMWHSLRTSAILTGYRGQPAADVAALCEALLRVSALVEVAPEIAELDLNPVAAFLPGQGVAVLDARVRIAPLGIR